MDDSTTINEQYIFVSKWGGYSTDHSVFTRAYGVATDSSNNIYVVDEKSHRIQKFDSSGTFIDEWGGYGFDGGELFYPYYIAIDSSDKIYITADNCTINTFSSNGTFICKQYSPGTGDDQFQEPAGIAVDSSGNIYVADTKSDRIVKYDSNGNNITAWGTFWVRRWRVL